LSATIDTTPDYPEQPPALVEAAERDLPAVLQEMPNEAGNGASDSGHGHRVVISRHLLKKAHRRSQKHEASGPMGEPRLEKVTVMAGPITQETQPPATLITVPTSVWASRRPPGSSVGGWARSILPLHLTHDLSDDNPQR
jgi:hypothetical protein